jgi:hypothetical protein
VPHSRAVALALALVALAPMRAAAQQVWAGGAWLVDVQRFGQGDIANRLDGRAPGWVVLAHTQPMRRLAVGAEWSSDTIDDVRETVLDVEGRVVTVRSVFAHRTRMLAALAGYTHGAGARSRLSYLAGVGLVAVERRFATNAPALVLSGRSDRTVLRANPVEDRFASLTGGVDLMTRFDDGFYAVGGARIARLTLQPGGQRGWSVRLFAGGAWAF